MSYKSQIPSLRYDAKHISADIPIREAISMYTDVDPYKRGNINCPSPNHQDKQPSAHIYEHSNRCKCFSCGGNFDPISLVQECFPELSFPEACRKLIDDFNLDIYQYSNLREIEAIKGAKEKNVFYDYFPIKTDEMTFIGLQNPSWNDNDTISVEQVKYDKAQGYITPPEDAYDKDGNPVVIKISKSEAVELGFLSPYDKEIAKNAPKLQDMWKDDKDLVENMIINKCQEQMDNIVQEISYIKEFAQEYTSTHSENEIKAVNMLRDAFIEASINAAKSGKEVSLSDEQRQQINTLYAFESVEASIARLNDDYEKTEEIMVKVQDHRKEREKSQNKSQNRDVRQ